MMLFGVSLADDDPAEESSKQREKETWKTREKELQFEIDSLQAKVKELRDKLAKSQEECTRLRDDSATLQKGVSNARREAEKLKPIEDELRRCREDLRVEIRNGEVLKEKLKSAHTFIERTKNSTNSDKILEKVTTLVKTLWERLATDLVSQSPPKSPVLGVNLCCVLWLVLNKLEREMQVSSTRAITLQEAKKRLSLANYVENSSEPVLVVEGLDSTLSKADISQLLPLLAVENTHASGNSTYFSFTNIESAIQALYYFGQLNDSIGVTFASRKAMNSATAPAPDKLPIHQVLQSMFYDPPQVNANANAAQVHPQIQPQIQPQMQPQIQTQVQPQVQPQIQPQVQPPPTTDFTQQPGASVANLCGTWPAFLSSLSNSLTPELYDHQQAPQQAPPQAPPISIPPLTLNLENVLRQFISASPQPPAAPPLVTQHTVEGTDGRTIGDSNGGRKRKLDTSSGGESKRQRRDQSHPEIAISRSLFTRYTKEDVLRALKRWHSIIEVITLSSRFMYIYAKNLDAANAIAKYLTEMSEGTFKKEDIKISVREDRPLEKCTKLVVSGFPSNTTDHDLSAILADMRTEITSLKLDTTTHDAVITFKSSTEAVKVGNSLQSQNGVPPDAVVYLLVQESD